MEVGVGVGEPAGMTPMFEFNSPPASSFNNPLFLKNSRMELTENPLFRLFTLYYIKYFFRPKVAAIDHLPVGESSFPFSQVVLPIFARRLDNLKKGHTGNSLREAWEKAVRRASGETHGTSVARIFPALF